LYSPASLQARWKTGNAAATVWNSASVASFSLVRAVALPVPVAGKPSSRRRCALLWFAAVPLPHKYPGTIFGSDFVPPWQRLAVRSQHAPASEITAGDIVGTGRVGPAGSLAESGEVLGIVLDHEIPGDLLRNLGGLHVEAGELHA